MKKTFIHRRGLLGVISLLSYTAAVVFSPLAYPGYDWMAQAVSDLMAENAPSKMLWNQLASLYGVCGMVSIMMVCVFVEGKLNLTIRLGIVPKEYFGIPERFSLFAATGFNAVLGLYLFRGFQGYHGWHYEQER